MTAVDSNPLQAPLQGSRSATYKSVPKAKLEYISLLWLWAALFATLRFVLYPVVRLVELVFLWRRYKAQKDAGEILAHFTPTASGGKRTLIVRRYDERRDIMDAPVALANSFFDDPLTLFMFRGAEATKAMHSTLCRAIRTHFWCEPEHGYIIESQQEGVILGAALTTDAVRPWWTEFLELILLCRMLMAQSVRFPGSMHSKFNFVNALPSKCTEVIGPFAERCRLLRYIGIAKGFQGQRIGSTLMEQVLADVDKDGLWAYLESSNVANVPLYERFGFRVVEEYCYEAGAPPLYLMVRLPVKVISEDFEHVEAMKARFARYAGSS